LGAASVVSLGCLFAVLVSALIHKKVASPTAPAARQEQANLQSLKTLTPQKSQTTPQPHRPDPEDLAVRQVLLDIKSPDEAVRNRGLTSIINQARLWRPTSCTTVAKELAGIKDDKFIVSRALCQLTDRLGPDPTEEQSGVARVGAAISRPDILPSQFIALDSLKTVNLTLHDLVVEFLTIKFAKRGEVANKFVNLGEAGKPAALIIQGYIIRFARSTSYRKSPFSRFGQELEDCLRALVAMAPDETGTLDAIYELLRYYAGWSKQGHRADTSEEHHVVYFLQQLGTFGSRAQLAIPVLRQLILDTNANIKATADNALRQIRDN
jgi:hypothetical protein